jgi:multicomponent Na+:H+ antiporter subunit E
MPGDKVRLGLGLAAALSATWLLLSGHFEPLMLSFGAASVGLVVWLSHRMGLLDEEGVPLDIHSPALLSYVPWLLWQVVLSSLDVSRRILRPGLDIAPRLLTVEPTQRTNIGRVLYANSITLTPGTVSMQMYDGGLLVHALHADAAADLEGGEMDRRVSAVEWRP